MYYRYDAALRRRTVDTGYLVANGPALSPDGGLLYTVESQGHPGRRPGVYVSQLTADGDPEEQRLLIPWDAYDSVPELAAFQDEPPQMRSGAVGKSGFLHLGFERRGRRTILADLDYRIPYRAQRALYCDDAMPDLAHVFLITTTGCLLQGDRMALDITLHEVVPDVHEPGLFMAHVSVGGGRGPFRLYVYMDGELVGAWYDASDRYEFRAPERRGPRSVVTVRAIDSTGRWGGTSRVIRTAPVVATTPVPATAEAASSI